MTCRESKLTSALTTIARCMTGVEDNQVLRLSHLLQDEVLQDTAPPTSEEWNLFINQTIAAYESGQLRITGASEDPRVRLNAARNETPDARRFYAAQRILQRCERANNAQTEYFNNYARDLGVPATHVATEFWQHFEDATANRRVGPSRAFENAFRGNPDNSNLFMDRRSLYAYEQMAIMRETRVLAQQSRPAVTRHPVEGSSFISEYGYNPTTGRFEIVMRSNPERVYAYILPPTVFAEFENAPSIGSYFSRNIRGNRSYLYSTQEESDNAGVQRRCANCGQWQDENHSCPITGSEENLNQDIREAIRRARTRAAGVQEEQASSPATVTRMVHNRTRRYPTPTGTLRAPSDERIRQDARRSTQILVPLTAGTTDGNTISGFMQVEYNGRGRGYSLEAVTEPGSSGTDNLRCTCAEYRRRYRCVHIDNITAEMSALVNQTEMPLPTLVQESIQNVTTTLTENYETISDSNAESLRNWRPVGVSFEEDPTIFQEMYKDARAARAAWKEAIAQGNTDNVPYPVPYYRENAFGGLGTRASGRGFGTEIEFCFPENMSYEEMRRRIDTIGQELYALGLTNNARQQYDKASAGWIRDYHERGWAYESDGSVNGGEIISPIMYDEPETWGNISAVCNILKRNGAIPSNNAGLHVHVGTADYDHEIEKHNRLLSAFAENEDLIYRLSANPSTGKHRGYYYCRPNTVPASPYTTINSARTSHNGHHLGLNLQSVTGQDGDNVEFRTFDSSLEPAAIQAQIGLSLMITEGAKRDETASVPPSGRHPLGERYESNPRRGTLTGDAWHESTRTFRRFIDKFVPGSDDERNNPRIKQLVSVFAMTKWQKNDMDLYW